MNSVTMVTGRHHETCQMMPNSYPEWRNFPFAPKNHYGFLLFHALPFTITFKLQYALFYWFYSKISHFPVKQWPVRRLLTSFTSKRLAEDDVFLTSKRQAYILTSCTRVVLHPRQCNTTFTNPGRVNRNSGRYARNNPSIILSDDFWTAFITVHLHVYKLQFIGILNWLFCNV